MKLPDLPAKPTLLALLIMAAPAVPHAAVAQAAVPADVAVRSSAAEAATKGAAEGAAEAAAVRDELMAHFDVSMRKFIALAEAMPAERFAWSPGEGVMEVGEVFMHVARYNYGYPSQNMDAALPDRLPLPDGVTLETMEAVRDQATVLRALRESRSWVEGVVGGMSAAELATETRLYGRTVPRWAVVVQLVSHMNEHLGQSIAYARMNGVVPPWSR